MIMANQTTDQSKSDWPAGVSKPAQRALAGAGFTQLDQLTSVSEAELLKLHGVGPKALGELRRALEARGLSFADPSRRTP
jgi:hypothetical protein